MMRGEIWWADFGMPFGSEPGFFRPVVILQADAFNKSKIGTVIIVPLTTNLLLAEAPGNIYLDKEESGLTKDSVAVVSQVTVIDKKRLTSVAGTLKKELMKEIEEGVKLVLGLR
ncbi:MAG: type II toxin-antitoxin system PemK/MazF family toxin [Spirochaetia bacterium]|jgi:mRNA interferase MazF|nr:type II toxin-antitoxin system PemK/MazF family toxin [Spirochaetia bacterium]